MIFRVCNRCLHVIGKNDKKFSEITVNKFEDTRPSKEKQYPFDPLYSSVKQIKIDICNKCLDEIFKDVFPYDDDVDVSITTHTLSDIVNNK